MFVRIYSIPIQLWFDRDLISPPVISPFFFHLTRPYLPVVLAGCLCQQRLLQEFQEMGQRLNELLFKGGRGASTTSQGCQKDFRCKNRTRFAPFPKNHWTLLQKKKGVWICIAGVWDLQTTTFWDPMILRVDWVRGSPPSILEQKTCQNSGEGNRSQVRLTSFP